MLILILLFFGAPLPKGYEVAAAQRGLASVYWPGDGHSGTYCADGKRFTKERCHIAHRDWPLGRKVRVCSVRTKKCTISFVGDRGPFGACGPKGIRRDFRCKGRWLVKIRKKDPGVWRGIADLSRCVWRKIGGPGMQIVTIELLRRKRKPSVARRKERRGVHAL